MIGGGGTFKYNATCEREIELLGGMGQALEATGGDVVQAAAAIAPRRTGAYVASLRAASERAGEGWVGYALADVRYAPFVEFGSPTIDEYAPLRTGAAATR